MLNNARNAQTPHRIPQAGPIHYFTGRCPGGMPPGEWNHIRRPAWPFWLAYSPFLYMLPTAVWTIVDLNLGGSGQTSVAFPVATGLLLLGIIWQRFIVRSRERRFQRELRRVGYELCLNCGYDLTGLPEVRRCPECGAAFDKVQVRRTWKAWFGEEESA